jgi:hypothetical protein
MRLRSARNRVNSSVRFLVYSLRSLRKIVSAFAKTRQGKAYFPFLCSRVLTTVKKAGAPAFQFPSNGSCSATLGLAVRFMLGPCFQFPSNGSCSATGFVQLVNVYYPPRF